METPPTTFSDRQADLDPCQVQKVFVDSIGCDGLGNSLFEICKICDQTLCSLNFLTGPETV